MVPTESRKLATGNFFSGRPAAVAIYLTAGTPGTPRKLDQAARPTKTRSQIHTHIVSCHASLDIKVSASEKRYQATHSYSSGAENRAVEVRLLNGVGNRMLTHPFSVVS
jgi:hypothetical protein